MANNSTTAVVISIASNSTEIIFEGWRHSGRDRGTIDILWDCLVTIILCCWVSTYPNVPSLNDKWYHRFVDKFNLACIGLVGPDYLFGIALGQLANARRSVKLFAQIPELLDGRRWTLTHGFFADMGGFLLASPDYPQGFPVTSEQLFYLVKHGHVGFPSLTRQEIKDMSHVDTLSKVIVVWQVIWFCVAELQRTREGLPMSTLELTALSFALMMIGTSAAWYHKPSIARPVIISTKNERTVAEIRAIARNTTHPGLPEKWYRTPLYFISGPRFWPDVSWSYYKELTYKVPFPIFGRKLRQDLWDRIPEDVLYPHTYNYLYLLGTPFMVGFSLSFLASWNFHFPSTTEKMLWRSVTIYHCLFALFSGCYYLYGEWRFRKACRRPEPAKIEAGNTLPTESSDDIESRPPKPESVTGRRGRAHRVWNRVTRFLDGWRNISRNQDPEMKVHLTSTWSIWVFIAIYILCRLFIYVEDFISLRSQPEGVFVTVNRYFPIGV